MKTKAKLLKQNRGSEIAKMLWSELELEPEGSFWDKYGIDAHLNGQTAQIKYDSRIATSQNLYHEIYEKTALRADQPWRKSPGIAALYIFTTESTQFLTGYLVSVDTLANHEKHKPLIAINPNDGNCTSLGFILPLNSFNPNELEVRRLQKRAEKAQGFIDIAKEYL